MVWPFVMSFSFRFAVINMCRWDALLFGEHRRINPEESDLKKMLNTFHKRPPEKAYGDRKKLHEKILSYVPHMQFKFEPDCVNPATFLFNPGDSHSNGSSSRRISWNRQKPNELGVTERLIYISTSRIDALLNKNLNVCFLLVGTQLLIMYRLLSDCYCNTWSQ
jgi:hypothetical protein